jgi:hypothetical protein
MCARPSFSSRWLETLSYKIQEVLHLEAAATSESIAYERRRQIESIVIFRTALLDGKLCCYVRDPATGDVLRLPIHGWIDADLSKPMYCDYLSAGEDEILATAAIVRDQRQVVFLIKSEFDEWFAKTFGERAADNRAGGSRCSHIARDFAASRSGCEDAGHREPTALE